MNDRHIDCSKLAQLADVCRRLVEALDNHDEEPEAPTVRLTVFADDAPTPPSHDEVNVEHYRAARAKHPHFADRMLRSEENENFKEMLAASRRHLRRAVEMCDVAATDVLECELAELYEAMDRSDWRDVEDEAYDCAAVLWRIVDMARRSADEPRRDRAKKDPFLESTERWSRVDKMLDKAFKKYAFDPKDFKGKSNGR